MMTVTAGDPEAPEAMVAMTTTKQPDFTTRGGGL